MAQVADLDYILSDCFLAVGQAVGSERAWIRDRDVVAPAVSAGLPPCDDRQGHVLDGGSQPGHSGRSVSRPARGRARRSPHHHRRGGGGARFC